MKKLILCDFDGTVSTRDTGYDLVTRFSSGDWEEINRDFSEGKIGSKEAYLRLAKILKGDKKTLFSFARDDSEIDPSFPAFYRYCKHSGIGLKIVSDGLDFYIQTILEIHHLAEIPFYANRTHFLKGGGMNISFPHLNEECGRCGTCKRKLVHLHRKGYDSILFVGNGFSDRCAAQEADVVFAKGSLHTYCLAQSLPCHFFRTFEDILGDLKKGMG